MKLFKRLRGPRIGTKLMLLSLTLLVVPWFSYRQLLEMERLLVQGQSQAQLLTAEGISTLFNGREDLFNDLPVKIEDYESLFARPLESGVRLDGNYEDWGDEKGERLLRFGPTGSAAAQDGAFRLALGERAGQLHVFVEVTDPNVVYRNPDYLRLDNADHLRVSFIRSDGGDGRISLVLTEPDLVTAYSMDPDWRFATTGKPETTVLGAMALTASGWNLEFRLPLEMLGSRRHFAISLADVDDGQTRELAHLTQTLPTADSESFNLVVMRSSEVLNIIRGLDYSGARIMVIDAQQRVRAESGAAVASAALGEADDFFSDAIHRGFEAIRPWVHRISTLTAWEAYGGAPLSPTADEVISASLNGEPRWVRRAVDEQLEVIMAAHPIVSKDAVIGAVVVEQNIDDILSFRRAALEQAILFSIFSLLAVLIALLAFAGRLAWRIRHLRQEASTAIDRYGRLQATALRSEIDSGDEIGDLARSISNMLSKLHQHNHFLESMPRTLRHEINNPLNTLSTSLQNLAEESSAVQDSKYLASAKSGVIRIGSIVQNLADAANLEESLKAEELEVVDIQKLLESYVSNCSSSNPNCKFIYIGVKGAVHAKVSDYRIEQLLDKIIDNAIDFHRPGSPITVQLDVRRNSLRIVVANRGPVLPDDSGKSLFDSMVSHRGPQNRLHFGLGLYVVRVIAEHHGGYARALNLTDGSGVVVMVELPLAAPPALQAVQRKQERLPPIRADQASRYRAAS